MTLKSQFQNSTGTPGSNNAESTAQTVGTIVSYVILGMFIGYDAGTLVHAFHTIHNEYNYYKYAGNANTNQESFDTKLKDALNFMGFSENTKLTKSIIDKRYKKLAFSYHPDHDNGDENLFIKLGNARDVLYISIGITV